MTSIANQGKGTGRVARPVSAMPEALTRRDRPSRSWRVEEGLPIRGDAFTNLDAHIMRVPFGSDESSRVIRAHEMTHAKVSPSLDVDALAKASGVSGGMIRAVEELRVNLLVASAGFDVDRLVDGSERTTGERLARSESIRPLVEMAVATMFTKAHTELVKGVRSVRPDLADALDHLTSTLVEPMIVEEARAWGLRGRLAKRGKASRLGNGLREYIAQTSEVLIDPSTAGVYNPSERIEQDVRDRLITATRGFGFTFDLARKVNALITSDSPNGEGEAKLPPTDEDETTGRGGSTSLGSWAPLVWDRSVSLNRWAPNVMGRRRVRTTSGIVPRRVDLLLTDPDRRIFSRDVRSTGGVVLIDQSGSMSLSIDDVERLVEASTGCVVIGYSHRPRSKGVPNVWTLADRGRIASRLRKGNGGNGCDRPALDHALAIRRGSEPIVWVCDGAVTYHDDSLASRADRLSILRDVRRHGVHMVDTVEEAIDALRLASTGRLRARYAPSLVWNINEEDVKEVWG